MWLRVTCCTSAPDEAEAGLGSDHDSGEDLYFGHFQHMLKDSDLVPALLSTGVPRAPASYEIGMSSVSGHPA